MPLRPADRDWNQRDYQRPTIYMPGAVPADLDERNRFLNYQRDTAIPKHRVRWNWIADLPFGKGKPIRRQRRPDPRSK